MNTAAIARSALHETHLALGARMVVREGWEVPDGYGSVEAELEAARAQRAPWVALGEWVGMGVLEVVGTGLPELAERLGVGDVLPGMAAPVTPPGGSEARWCRCAVDEARVLVGRGEVAVARAGLMETGPRAAEASCLHVTDLSSGLTTLAVVGPRSPDLLARLLRVDLDPRVFGDRRLALTGAAGVPLQVLRWDRSGGAHSGPAYELAVGRDVAEYFWELFARAGEDLGLKFIGAVGLGVME
jgi:glycine cleavage system aminomethyltransferase T